MEWSDGSLRSSGSCPAGEGIRVAEKQLADCQSMGRVSRDLAWREEGERPGDERSIFCQIRQWICHHSHLQYEDTHTGNDNN